MIAHAIGLMACVGQSSDSQPVTFIDRPFTSPTTLSGTGGQFGGQPGSNVAVQQVTGGTLSTGGMALPTGGVVPLAGGTVISGGTGGMLPAAGGELATGGTLATGGALATGGTSGSVRTVTMADFSVTTTSPGGRYSPRNIGAIWVQNAQGQWVKTLAHWAGIRGFYLSKYGAANPTNNVVDAVTSATLSNHVTHDVSWNLKDANGTPAPDGMYSIVMEMTDKDSAGPSTSVSFTLGSDPAMQSFPDASNFTKMSLNIH